MLNELAGKKRGGMKLANKYCYVKKGSQYCKKSVCACVVTVRRYKQHPLDLGGELCGDYGVACYSAVFNKYSRFIPCGGKRFKTAREAQIYLNAYAIANGLSHAEREY